MADMTWSAVFRDEDGRYLPLGGGSATPNAKMNAIRVCQDFGLGTGGFKDGSDQPCFFVAGENSKGTILESVLEPPCWAKPSLLS